MEGVCFDAPWLPIYYSYKPMNSMSTFIKTDKDKIKKEDLSNVVYKVNCQDCNYSYVGQTNKKLKTRLKEHIKDFNKPTTFLSVISYHKLESDHTID